jgi:hypothetical protein
MNSALPSISQPVSSEALLRRIRGVLPIASITERGIKDSLCSVRRNPRNPKLRFQGKNRLAQSHFGHCNFLKQRLRPGIHFNHVPKSALFIQFLRR